jgi:hypothetical protein
MKKHTPFLATTLFILSFPAIGMESDKSQIFADWNKARDLELQARVANWHARTKFISDLNNINQAKAFKQKDKCMSAQIADLKSLDHAKSIAKRPGVDICDKINTLVYLENSANFLVTRKRIECSMEKLLPALPAAALPATEETYVCEIKPRPGSRVSSESPLRFRPNSSILDDSPAVFMGRTSSVSIEATPCASPCQLVEVDAAATADSGSIVLAAFKPTSKK